MGVSAQRPGFGDPAAVTADGPAIQLQNVLFRWRPRGGFQLYVPDFQVRSGERVLLIGGSGSGKSTLLSLLAGISTPTSGHIAMLNENVGSLSRSARDRFRAERLGIVFQSFNLLPFLTARQNVELALAFAPQRRQAIAPTSPGCAALALLQALDLQSEAAITAPSVQLSIGQQQRVALARALIGNPPILLADEPTAALDPANSGRFMTYLARQLDASGATLLMVSHDERLVPHFDRIVAIHDIATEHG